MRLSHALTALSIGLLSANASHATGLATCESGPKSGWQPQAELQKKLEADGWKVRKIKEDGGCYEVYGLDKDGKRVEVYFHPVTFAPVPTKAK